jgi:hypothetical protein
MNIEDFKRIEEKVAELVVSEVAAICVRDYDNGLFDWEDHEEVIDAATSLTAIYLIGVLKEQV